MRPISILAARHIAEVYGYDQVVIIARKVGEGDEPHGEHCTTYGRNKAHCTIAARIGMFLKTKVMGWPADEQEELSRALIRGSEVRLLREDIERLSAALTKIRTAGYNWDATAQWMQQVAASALEPGKWPDAGEQPATDPPPDPVLAEMEEHVQRLACWRDAGDVLREVREWRDRILERQEARRQAARAGSTKGVTDGV